MVPLQDLGEPGEQWKIGLELVCPISLYYSFSAFDRKVCGCMMKWMLYRNVVFREHSLHGVLTGLLSNVLIQLILFHLVRSLC